MSSREYEYEENEEYFNNKECKLCSDSPSMNVSFQPKIRKISENTIKLEDHRNNYFLNESQQSDEYINIDSWNNYENTIHEDSGIINLCIEDSEMCNSNYIGLRGEVVDVNNEYERFH